MTGYKTAEMRRAETQAVWDDMDYRYTVEYLESIDEYRFWEESESDYINAGVAVSTA